MDIRSYFDPIDIPRPQVNDETLIREKFGDRVVAFTDPGNFPDYSDCDIAIIGVPEDRFAISNDGCALAPDPVRMQLYELYPGSYIPRVADLGNLKRGFEVNDTYFALSEVIATLLKQEIIPLVIGGSQDLTYANYLAYESLGQIINIVAVDHSFDLGKSEEDMNAGSYLSRIILHQPNYLFNFANIGYQTYFSDQDAIRLMKNLFFDALRLGKVRQSIEEVEPIVRNADILSFDISSIRFSDAPGCGRTTPNGFYGEEACQIVRYAGMSDKLTSIGFYEMNPRFDTRNQTALLVAQMIWYFFDGFYNRKHDFPFTNPDDYVVYRVPITDHKEEIVFYKSRKSDRWWMEVPLQSEMKVKYLRHYLVPCSYQDYQTACSNDVPDRWWMVCQKLM